MACGRSPDPAAAPTPQQVVDELLAADRGFSAAGANAELTTSLSAMFAPDVVMPVAGGLFAEGLGPVVKALTAHPDNAGARAEWTPVRGGVSGDGLHGFTYGFMTVHRADGSTVPVKYLSYWVKGQSGWQVAAYKRRPRPEGEVALTLGKPALPPAIIPAGDSAATGRFREELAQAERDFSRDAQTMGLGPAFAKYGSPDAMNMGGPDVAAFVVGNDAIAASVSAGGPASGSAVTWGPDRVIAASSGDLGVTIGVIVSNTVAADGSRPRFAFFTVWRRDTPADPWRYVAE